MKMSFAVLNDLPHNAAIVNYKVSIMYNDFSYIHR